MKEILTYICLRLFVSIIVNMVMQYLRLMHQRKMGSLIGIKWTHPLLVGVEGDVWIVTSARVNPCLPHHCDAVQSEMNDSKGSNLVFLSTWSQLCAVRIQGSTCSPRASCFMPGHLPQCWCTGETLKAVSVSRNPAFSECYERPSLSYQASRAY